MSAVVSTSAGRRYGLARVCRVWGVARSGVYRLRRAAAAAAAPAPRRRPGPQGADGRRGSGRGDQAGAGRQPLSRRGLPQGLGAASPSRSADVEGAGAPPDARETPCRRRPGWAAPAARATTTARSSPRRSMRCGATDMTAAFTVEHGQVAVFVAVDHCSAECVGIHAARRGTRHEALEPIRQGVVERFGDIAKDIAQGLSVRHDHGSQYMSHDFQREVAWLGAASSPAFVRAPEGNGCAERFIRTLKENLLWVRTFPDRRGTPPRPPRVPTDLQRALADRAARPPLARPVPTRPDGPRPAGRIDAIRCLTNRGRYRCQALGPGHADVALEHLREHGLRPHRRRRDQQHLRGIVVVTSRPRTCRRSTARSPRDARPPARCGTACARTAPWYRWCRA